MFIIVAGGYGGLGARERSWSRSCEGRGLFVAAGGAVWVLGAASSVDMSRLLCAFGRVVVPWVEGEGVGRGFVGSRVDGRCAPYVLERSVEVLAWESVSPRLRGVDVAFGTFQWGSSSFMSILVDVGRRGRGVGGSSGASGLGPRWGDDGEGSVMGSGLDFPLAGRLGAFKVTHSAIVRFRLGGVGEAGSISGPCVGEVCSQVSTLSLTLVG
jgi:hypothetical protein